MSKTRFRHFYDTEETWTQRLDDPGVKRRNTRRGKLVATIATQDNEDGTVAVGISRVHKDDQGSKWKGRSLAFDRLTVWQGAKDGPSYSATYDATDESADLLKKQNLALDVTKEELVRLIRSNPFVERNCPYGRKAQNK